MNILKSILILSSLLAFISCSRNTSDLSDEKLAEIIADMHISEMALERYDVLIVDSLQEVYLDKLEQIHGVSREVIKREVETLMEDRSRQSAVYKLVIDRLQDLEADVKADRISNTYKSNKDG